MTKRDGYRFSRRSFLSSAAALSGTLLLPVGRIWSAEGASHLSDSARKAAAESSLIYISPLRSDGNESRCHAEIWFVPIGEDLLVCTPADAWRSRAIKKGLDKARIWIGDFGNWKSSGGKYKSAPSLLADASILSPEDAVVAKCLAAMGTKYETTGWSNYGPRFHTGVKDGSRVIIRYRSA